VCINSLIIILSMNLLNIYDALKGFGKKNPPHSDILHIYLSLPAWTRPYDVTSVVISSNAIRLYLIISFVLHVGLFGPLP
jgi:hypothetical protein